MTMSVIKQGAEPVAFKSYFVAWEPQMWNKKMSFEDQMNAVKQDNDKVDDNAWSMVWAFKTIWLSVTQLFSWEELRDTWLRPSRWRGAWFVDIGSSRNLPGEELRDMT